MRAVRIVLIIVIASVVFYFSFQFIVKKYFEYILKRQWEADKVIIEICKLSPLLKIYAEDIEIRKDGVYFRIDKMRVDVSSYLLRREAVYVKLNEPEVIVEGNLNRTFFSGNKKNDEGGFSAFLNFPLDISLDDLSFYFFSGNGQLKFKGSLHVKIIPEGRVHFISLGVEDLFIDFPGKLFLKGFSIKGERLQIEKFKINTIEFGEIEGEVICKAKAIYVKLVSVPLLGKNFKSEGDITLDLKKGNIKIGMEFLHINMGKFLQEILRDQDISLQGVFDGRVVYEFPFRSKGYLLNLAISSLKGKIKVSKQKLAFLKERMRNIEYKVLVERLSDYEYNKCDILLKTERDDLWFIVDVDRGNIHFEQVFHNILRR